MTWSQFISHHIILMVLCNHTPDYVISSIAAFFVLALICHGNTGLPKIALRGLFQEMPGQGKQLTSQPHEQGWAHYNGVLAQILADLLYYLSSDHWHCLCDWLPAECGRTQNHWLTAASGVGRYSYKLIMPRCQFNILIKSKVLQVNTVIF